MPITQTRRRFLTTLRWPARRPSPRPGARRRRVPLETTTVRLAKVPTICIAPQYIADELLRAEGFTDIRYVDAVSTPS